MEKGEIAHFEQFLFFPQCFLKAFLFNVLKLVCMEERVNQRTYITIMFTNQASLNMNRKSHLNPDIHPVTSIIFSFSCDIRYLSLVSGLPTDSTFYGKVTTTKACSINQDTNTFQAETMPTLHHTPLKW